MMTDPISDMLTRIRNANQRQFKKVSIPTSNIKLQIAQILKEEGYITDFKINEKPKDGTHSKIDILLKYKASQRVIWGLKRISKPGLRVYVKNSEIPKVLNGLGIAIISTSIGVMTDAKARENRLGGEVLAFVW
ncbi:30S ribosomal protein S8 [Spiroplasma endosymbiont of 'Nebria riversi']|uniref:30S ribosomal protein S8 n=1 Tax=Spiroplasma endosymbiont of 'Nebria riversi' TaxID=2792084 RepID=UPI001C0482BC|nr:30S ribosomal protein S8 [Spiroplasma endosymbiont of 'Nebria riversi']